MILCDNKQMDDQVLPLLLFFQTNQKLFIC